MVHLLFDFTETEEDSDENETKLIFPAKKQPENLDENNNKIFEKPSKENVFKSKEPEPVIEEKFEAKKAQPSSVYKDDNNEDKSPNYQILDDLKSVTKHGNNYNLFEII